MLKDITAERWVDVSGIHMTAKSRLDTQFAFYRKEVLLEDECRRNFDPMPDYGETPSPGIIAAQVLKHNKYAPMMRTAVMQHNRRLRKTRPIFYGCIASHEGEWSDDMHSAVEFIAMSRYAEVASGPKRRDGLQPEHASAQIRGVMRDGIAAAIAKGFGMQLSAGGFPRKVDDEQILPNEDGFY
jgi:hypothetical protein